MRLPQYTCITTTRAFLRTVCFESAAVSPAFRALLPTLPLITPSKINKPSIFKPLSTIRFVSTMSSKLVPQDPEKVMVIRDVVPNVITTLSVPFMRFGKIKVGGRGTVGMYIFSILVQPTLIYL